MIHHFSNVSRIRNSGIRGFRFDLGQARLLDVRSAPRLDLDRRCDVEGAHDLAGYVTGSDSPN
jgi:hypothetical protein